MTRIKRLLKLISNCFSFELKIKGCLGQMTRIKRLLKQVSKYGRDKE